MFVIRRWSHQVPVCGCISLAWGRFLGQLVQLGSLNWECNVCTAQKANRRRWERFSVTYRWLCCAQFSCWICFQGFHHSGETIHYFGEQIRNSLIRNRLSQIWSLVEPLPSAALNSLSILNLFLIRDLQPICWTSPKWGNRSLIIRTLIERLWKKLPYFHWTVFSILRKNSEYH